MGHILLVLESGDPPHLPRIKKTCGVPVRLASGRITSDLAGRLLYSCAIQTESEVLVLTALIINYSRKK
jgi:hypothetical protein